MIFFAFSTHHNVSNFIRRSSFYYGSLGYGHDSYVLGQ